MSRRDRLVRRRETRVQKWRKPSASSELMRCHVTMEMMIGAEDDTTLKAGEVLAQTCFQKQKKPLGGF